MSLHQLSQGAKNSVLFVDRHEAGEKLSALVLQVVQTLDTPHRFIVYALPRGGIPVAVPVAEVLNCPLDVLVAKKITRPDNPELAIGAVTADGHVIRLGHHRVADWEDALERARTKAQKQLAQFTERPNVDPEGAIALIVDDGIATGMTISVAALSLRKQNPAEIWICAPVAPAELVEQLEQYCDRVIVLATPDPFYSVSRFYKSFPQVELEDAVLGLKKSLQN
jgi:putative phosphoribosyl transferase